jgi:DNA-binding transcriptional LysR family regulator
LSFYQGVTLRGLGGQLQPKQELIDQLRKLWILDLVARHGSFQIGATHAKVTRSAVSQTISQLEKLYGKTLLVRQRGAVKTTAYCDSLLRKARPILDSLALLEESPEITSPAMSWLDIGAFESLAIEVMPNLLQRLQRLCPGIRVTVRVGRSGKLATMVRKGELCMAIVIENDLCEGLTLIPLATDRLGLFISQGASLQKLPVGTIQAGPEGVPLYYSKFTKALKLEKRISFHSDSLEALLAACCYGSIAAILPLRVAQRATTRLVEITPSDLKKGAWGVHSICLISQKNCSAEENAFLAQEVTALLKNSTPTREFVN